MLKQVLRLKFEVLENIVSGYKSKHRRYRSSPPSLPSSANFVNSLTLRICSLPSGDFKFSTFDLKKSAWLARRESSGIPSLYLRNKVSKSYRSGKKGLHLSSEQATCKRWECGSSETVLFVQVAIVDVNLLKKWYRRRYILVFLLWTFTVEHAMHQSCEDVFQSGSEPDDLLVFALFGNGSNQIELRGNVCNVELLFVLKKKDEI